MSRPAHGKESDRKGPTIRGITFTQYAYRAIDIEGKKPAALVSEEPTDDPIGPQEPGTYGREVMGTTLENVTISFCSRVAGYFRGDGLVLRSSLMSDTSTEGFYVIGSSDVLLERNIFRRNNVEQLTGYYPAAVKIFNQSHRVTVRDNLVIDNPHSNGVWWDVGNRDGVFVNNWVENALVGFFFEISRGATVAGNVFVGCGRGAWALNSANVRVYHNTFVDSVASFERNERSAVETTSAGTPARRRTSTSARGTSSRGTCWWRASRTAIPCCASSSRRPCAAGSPGPRRPRWTATSTCARRRAGPSWCGARSPARAARWTSRRSRS